MWNITCTQLREERRGRWENGKWEGGGNKVGNGRNSGREWEEKWQEGEEQR